MLKITLSGQFSAHFENKRLAINSRYSQSLLAYLSLNSGVFFRRERLAGFLWPNLTDEKARHHLRQALWVLRRAIESLGLDAEDYIFCNKISLSMKKSEKVSLDIQPLLGKYSGKTQSIESLIEAVSVYKGELLPGFYEDWVLLERSRLDNAFEQAIRKLLNRLTTEERWEEVIYWCEHRLSFGNAHEAIYRSLMVAHAGLREYSSVIEDYERCKENLLRDFDIHPSEELKMHRKFLMNQYARDGHSSI
jgi:DNA-binding SARP family transcriptional activator